MLCHTLSWSIYCIYLFCDASSEHSIHYQHADMIQARMFESSYYIHDYQCVLCLRGGSQRLGNGKKRQATTNCPMSCRVVRLASITVDFFFTNWFGRFPTLLYFAIPVFASKLLKRLWQQAAWSCSPVIYCRLYTFFCPNATLMANAWKAGWPDLLWHWPRFLDWKEWYWHVVYSIYGIKYRRVWSDHPIVISFIITGCCMRLCWTCHLIVTVLQSMRFHIIQIRHFLLVWPVWLRNLFHKAGIKPESECSLCGVFVFCWITDVLFTPHLFLNYSWHQSYCTSCMFLLI